MAKRGMSIHIGLNNLCATHYSDTGFRFLPSCINDAKYMAELVSKYFKEPVPFYDTVKKQFDKKPNLLLLDENGNTNNLLQIMEEIAKGENKLVEGDILLLTYSGHGGQIPSREQPAESDGFDETWCLYDRQFIDEEIFELFTKFEKGVRILVISDSCNNGTVIGKKEVDILDLYKIVLFEKKFNYNNFQSKILDVQGHNFAKFEEDEWKRNKSILEGLNFDTSDNNLKKIEISKTKSLPGDLLTAIYKETNHTLEYRKKQHDVRIRLLNEQSKRKKNDIRELVESSVILISACQDWQKTAPGGNETELSKFTQVFKNVWNDGNFNNYLELHQKLWNFFDRTAINSSDIQNPNYYTIGTPNPTFELEKPLTV
ncbi:hypothetical protein BH20ACI1_BH20ACI1_07650 [soil metagenome]